MRRSSQEMVRSFPKLDDVVCTVIVIPEFLILDIISYTEHQLTSLDVRDVDEFDAEGESVPLRISRGQAVFLFTLVRGRYF